MATIPYFAFVDSIEDEPFDPAVHARRDAILLRGVRSQQEIGFATWEIDLKVPDGGTPAGKKDGCHVSTVIDGQIRWLFSGTIVRSDVARRGEVATLEFQAVDADLEADERRLLAGVRSSYRYVEELAVPNDDLDAAAILAHTTHQLEYTIGGRAQLVPIFGDPAKLRSFSASEILSYDPDVGGIPARGTLVTLNNTFVERHPVEKSIGAMVQEAIDLKAHRDLFSPSNREFLKVADPSSEGEVAYSPFVVLEYTDLQGNKSLSAIRLGYYDTYAEAQYALDHYNPDPGYVVRLDLSAITPLGSEPTANWTMTPDVIESWPKEGATMGDDFFVLRSAMIAVDGPGAKKSTNNGKGGKLSATYGIKIDQPSENAAGLPKDPSDYKGALTNTELDGTVFSDPILDVFGIVSQERREVIQVYVPNGCQELRRRNGPVKYINLTVDDMSEDRETPEWKGQTDYIIGDRVQFAGVTWQCLASHFSSDGSLYADMIQKNVNSPLYGERIWFPVPENLSPMRRSDLSRSIDSEFGRRCLAYAANRGCSSNAWEMRQVTHRITVSVDRAWDLDTSWTIRASHRSLKGGSVEGKVTGVDLTFDATRGAIAEITFVSAIGSYDPDKDDGDMTPEPGQGSGGEGGGEGEGYDHGVNPPVPLLDPYAIDWSTTAPINWYDVRWEDVVDDDAYYDTVDQAKLFFDYDRDGILDEDDDDSGEEPDPGDGDGEVPEENAAATADDRWARVKYRLPFYIPPSVDVDNLAKVDVAWLGYDQCRAMTRPGQTYPGGRTGFQVVYVYGQDAQDFLEDEMQTKITVTIANPAAGGKKAETMVVRTSPYLGPKQMEI